jgi:hypothetical protein
MQTITIRKKSDAQKLWGVLKNWEELAKDGKPITVTISAFEKKAHDSQRKAYFAMVESIAEQYEANGKRYDSVHWHEYFKERFLGGISTTSLNVTEYSEYMAKVHLFALELGVHFENDRVLL